MHFDGFSGTFWGWRFFTLQGARDRWSPKGLHSSLFGDPEMAGFTPPFDLSPIYIAISLPPKTAGITPPFHFFLRPVLSCRSLRISHGKKMLGVQMHLKERRRAIFVCGRIVTFFLCILGFLIRLCWRGKGWEEMGEVWGGGVLGDLGYFWGFLVKIRFF